jgi:protein ImuB
MFAAIFIPDFALQAILRYTPELRDGAVALIPEKSPKACIAQTTAAARNAGVVIGMTPSQGIARCRDLIVKTPSQDAERSARAALLDCAFGISPFVEETGEGICTVALHGGVRNYDQWLSQLRSLHLHARIGVAPDPDFALLAAQSATTWHEIRDPRELAEVAIETLEPPSHMRTIFDKWGIQTVGAFVGLGRERLVERLGAEVLPLFDRAMARSDRPLRCVLPRESFEEAVEFENEIETLEPLVFMLRRLLEQLVRRLELIYRVAAELTLRLGLANGEHYTHVFKVPSPTAQLDVLFRMVQTHLENFRTEQPIVSLRLVAVPCRPTRQQFGLFESALRDPNQFYETVARLVALLGHDRVGTPQLEPTHRPDAFRMVAQPFQVHACAEARRQTLTNGFLLRRFRPALPALVHAAPEPVFVHSREASGPVTAVDGPMLLSGDWWSGDGWSRCEWDLQLRVGPLCRIYEEGGAWFLEGIYD